MQGLQIKLVGRLGAPLQRRSSSPGSENLHKNRLTHCNKSREEFRFSKAPDSSANYCDRGSQVIGWSIASAPADTRPQTLNAGIGRCKTLSVTSPARSGSPTA